MFDRIGIYQRFSSSYKADTPVQLAKILGVDHACTFRWRAGTKPIPWKRLKLLVVEQAINWDWIIDGKKPRHHRDGSFSPEFEWLSINHRFLDAFADKTQSEIARELGVRQVSVSKWKRGEMHVPWEKLRYAVCSFNVSWNWLLEGYR